MNKLEFLNEDYMYLSKALVELEKAIGEKRSDEYVKDSIVYRFTLTFNVYVRCLVECLKFKGIRVRKLSHLTEEAMKLELIDDPKLFRSMVRITRTFKHYDKTRTERFSTKVVDIYGDSLKEWVGNLEDIISEINKGSELPLH